MTSVKKLILCHVPMSTCNLRCQYCYITLTKSWDAPPPKFRYSPEYMGKALSIERLGGPCFINICGNGETLMPKEMPAIIREILKQGHYVEVVTNGTLNGRYQELAALPADLLERLTFKFSFHYRELQRLHLMDNFFENIALMRACGCSFTLELPPTDDLLPDVDEIKRICMERVGAPCHLTILRDDRTADISVLSGMDLSDYYDNWESFDSAMFKYKRSIFGQRQCGFCYAGAWSFYYNLVTGAVRKCYTFPQEMNLYQDLSASLNLTAVGHNCPFPHCYNGHALLTFGTILGQSDVTYADIRNRICDDGTEWLNCKMKAFMSTKLSQSNPLYTEEQMIKADRSSGCKLRNVRIYKRFAMLIPSKWKKRLMQFFKL